MMVDTTIYGYYTEDGAFCPKCVGPEDDATANALYSLSDDDPEGLTCDDCGAVIFEPDYDSLWTRAIEDIMLGPASDWMKADRILRLFTDAGFEIEGTHPDPY